MDDQSSLIPDTSDPLPAASYATLIATDGRVVRIDPRPGGEIALTISGRQPVVLDRWQAAAFCAAAASLPEG